MAPMAKTKTACRGIDEAITHYGSVEKAVKVTGYSRRAWYRYKRQGGVTDAVRCLTIADATGIDPWRLAVSPGAE